MNARVSPRPSASLKRLLAGLLSAGLAGAGLVGMASPPASAALPSQCSVSGFTATCTYLKSGGSQTLDLPDGVTSLQVKAVGEAGAAASGPMPGAGGRGASVTGTVPVNGATQDVLIQFLNDNGLGASGGGSGGDSSRVQMSNLRGGPDTVAWAAGGGGGGTRGRGADFIGSGYEVPGANGGDAGAAGSDGIGTYVGPAPLGGGFGGKASAFGGAGGAGGIADLGAEDGEAGGAGGSRGGNGGEDASTTGGGGGGGGGVRGGGGGGGAAGYYVGFAYAGASGGGGGGWSSVPAGGAVSPSNESARIVLTFQVPPEAAVSPTSWAFPGTEVGGQSSGKIFTFTNTGPVPVAVSSVQLGGESPSQFVLAANTCPTNLPANSSCSVTVAFSPTSPGSKNAMLTFNSNAYGGQHVVELSGMSVATALLSIRGPGKTYAEGHGNRQTLTISKSTSAKATFYFKVTNTVGIDRDYRIVADSLGAAADVSVTPEKKKTPLPLDAFGRWITPTVPGGGSITLAFRVDPTDLGQVTAKHTLRLLTPSGAEHDRANFETNVQAPSKGTDGYGLYVKSAGKYAGGDVNGQTVTQEPAATGDTLKYTVRVRNDSVAAQSVLVKMQAASNLCWSISVKYKKADLTSAFLTGGYTTPSIKKGGSLSLAVAVTRLSDGCGAATWEFSTWDGATKVHSSSILANALAGTE